MSVDSIAPVEVIMTHTAALEVLRLRRKEQWAEAYFKRAMQSRNTRRAMRAAEFMTVVASRGNAIAMTEIAAFSR
jgi:hypothetical protein